VDYGRPSQLGESRWILTSWFQRGWVKRHAPADECFEPFIFTWIAFNGWAECVTGLEIDSQWTELLAWENALNGVAQLGLDSEPITSSLAQFAAFWPIPRMQHLRRTQAWSPVAESWQDTSRRYSGAGVSYAPRCARRHADRAEEIPRDWPHFLASVYRVRCNLFHGEKSLHIAGDQEIVASSFRTLVHLLPLIPESPFGGG
jgi:hypothetical protein